MSYQRMLDGDVGPTEDEIENTLGKIHSFGLRCVSIWKKIMISLQN